MKATALLLIVLHQVITLNQSYANDTKLNACSNALNACIYYSKEEAISIDLRNKEIAALEDQIVSDNSTHTRNTVLTVVAACVLEGLLIHLASH